MQLSSGRSTEECEYRAYLSIWWQSTWKGFWGGRGRTHGGKFEKNRITFLSL